MDAGGDPDDTRVTFIDSSDGSFYRQSVPVTDPNNLQNILSIRGPEVKTRIILVEYNESFCIDRNVVDIFGRAYDIDPLVFQEHFQHEALELDDGYSREIHESLPLERLAHLRSQSRTSVGYNLHFNFGIVNSTCVIVLGGNLGVNTTHYLTVVMWTRLSDWEGNYRIHPRFSEKLNRPRDRANRRDAKYEYTISQWDARYVTLADENLSEYAAPLINVFLEYHLDRFKNEWDPKLPDISRYLDDVLGNTLERS
ncbi:hypothetical protein IFR05_006460 [Cadophora sp. M221]|nr:hypothetical protein IFR05_006460 [Cadophora sp. M221]